MIFLTPLSFKDSVNLHWQHRTTPIYTEYIELQLQSSTQDIYHTHWLCFFECHQTFCRCIPQVAIAALWVHVTYLLQKQLHQYHTLSREIGLYRKIETSKSRAIWNPYRKKYSCNFPLLWIVIESYNAYLDTLLYVYQYPNNYKIYYQ